MNKEFPLVPVHGQAGCAGHLLRNAKGFRAFDTDSKELDTFKDAALAALTSTLRSQHSSKSGFLFSSRGSVRPATALCATAGFLSAMEPQRVTPRLHRKLLSR